jgi:hypothetical protein
VFDEDALTHANIGEFQLFFGFSVFSHLLPQDLVTILNRANRLLDDSGKIVASMFLLDSQSRKWIESGKTNWYDSEIHEYDGVIVHDPLNPEVSVCYPEEELRKLAEQSGFSISAIDYGNWRGINTNQFQDLVVFSKSSTAPADFSPSGYLTLNPDLALQQNINPYWHYKVYGRNEGRRYK